MASWPNNVYSLYTDKINSHVKVSPCSHRPAAYRPMCCVNDHGRLYVYAFCGIKNKNRFRIPLVEREPAAPQLPTSTSAVGSCSSVPLHFYLLMQKIFPENCQGQVERPLLSSASQARCSTNDSTALFQTISNNLCTD